MGTVLTFNLNSELEGYGSSTPSRPHPRHFSFITSSHPYQRPSLRSPQASPSQKRKPPAALPKKPMRSFGHPHVTTVAELLAHKEVIWTAIRERGEENDDLVREFESGKRGETMPQGSIKSFRQYADYLSLSSPPIPIWPITPVKVAFFLLFRVCMGDVSHGTLLRDQYVRGLARALEHYREDTAMMFLPKWPEAAQLILRDGRGDPEGRNDLTHDILRICKESVALGKLDRVLDVPAVEALVQGDNALLTPDAWATRRRLSNRWVRDPDLAKLPERQYTGGKFVGEPPKPPPLSGRSTHWNRHLHDLRGGAEETSWVPSPRGKGGLVSLQRSEDEDMDAEPRPRSSAMMSQGSGSSAPGGFAQRGPPTESQQDGAAASSSSHHGRSTTAQRAGFRSDAPVSPTYYEPEARTQDGVECLKLPSLTDVGIHPSSFPPIPPTPGDAFGFGMRTAALHSQPVPFLEGPPEPHRAAPGLAPAGAREADWRDGEHLGAATMRRGSKGRSTRHESQADGHRTG